MGIVDSCGWLEWFADGDLADQYQKYLANRPGDWAPTKNMNHQLLRSYKRVYP
jgi:hypothetical protein